MATAPKVYRELATPLDIPDDKTGAFAAVAAYYACEAQLGAKIVSYGDKKHDVGISYLSAVRLCSEKLTSLAGWPPTIVDLLVEYLDVVKAPMKKDDWNMTCFLIKNMEDVGFAEITRDDVVEFLAEEQEVFRSMHYEWLRYLQTGEAEVYKYFDVAEWEPSGDPAHPDFKAVEETREPAEEKSEKSSLSRQSSSRMRGTIVGATVEEKSENPFLSRQSSTFLPSGKVQVFFPNAQEGDAELRDQQAANVAKHAQLQASGDIEAARALKKTIMQQRISLGHRYTSILIEYHAKTGMYAGGVFHFLFRLPKGYPLKAPLCHCLTPIWHPNILHEPESKPREQNVCCSYIHDKDFADRSEQGYEPGMSLWKIVWAVCLLLHRFDTEGLGIFTLSNALNTQAADQFLGDEPGFIAKAKEYTARYATLDYHKAMKSWHEFYPNFEELYDPDSATEKLGKQSSIDKRLPETTLQETTGGASELEAIEHPAGPPEGAECSVFFVPIDATNFVEYRTAPSGRWYSAPVCEEVILDLLCGDHNQFTDWLKKIEALGSDPELCKTLKGRIFGQGPPIFLSIDQLPLPEGDSHVDVLFFGGGAPVLPQAEAEAEPEPEPEAGALAEFSGDGRYVSARLFGSVDGPRHAELWELHKQVYAFNDPDQDGPTAVPTVSPISGAGVTPTVEAHVQQLRDMYDALRA